MRGPSVAMMSLTVKFWRVPRKVTPMAGALEGVRACP